MKVYFVHYICMIHTYSTAAAVKVLKKYDLKEYIRIQKQVHRLKPPRT